MNTTENMPPAYERGFADGNAELKFGDTVELWFPKQPWKEADGRERYGDGFLAGRQAPVTFTAAEWVAFTKVLRGIMSNSNPLTKEDTCRALKHALYILNGIVPADEDKLNPFHLYRDSAAASAMLSALSRWSKMSSYSLDAIDRLQQRKAAPATD